tara:strand:+ start:13288 stop:15417 length:2130 start_codon:yes stop_codon:yes gene_type:complete
MKQIIQNIKTGKTSLEEYPSPLISKNSLLIKTSHSLVSLGTEKMLVEFSRSSILQKARQQPERVIEVLDKIKSDGMLPTLETVFRKLEEPIPLGYCNVGEVIDIGEGISEFTIGDRVVTNGPHAEIVLINKNLAAHVPKIVSSEDAAFTVVGSIGLQGIRLLNPTLGETVVVFGLGLIGILTCQLLMQNGCRVIGIDVDDWKCKKADEFGINTINPSDNDSVKYIMDLTNGIGSDGIIITASTKSDILISDAAKMSRKRGRIILVGVVGLNLNRSDFYEKELTFQVSCSYGPGRYDTLYENKGIDYPLPFVRWTEKRNFEAFLSSLESEKVKVSKLVTQKESIIDFYKIYDKIGEKNSIASLLYYDQKVKAENTRFEKFDKKIQITSQKGTIGLIGAGNFSKMTILPALKKSRAKIKSIAAKTGINANALAKKYKIEHTTTNYNDILNDEMIDTVIIATRHNMHAKLVIDCIRANKNIFVEKPLALSFHELNQVHQELKNIGDKSFMVGFNRRFSPHSEKIKAYLLKNSQPINIIANMNAGYIAEDHWVHDLSIGGGRIVGEACHLIDLCSFLAGSRIDFVCANSLGNNSSLKTDNVSILLKFSNGSNACVNYFSNGSKKYSKERVEVYSSDKTWVIDNFRRTYAYNVKGFKSLTTKIDKGHTNQFNKFINLVESGGKQLISIDELINTSSASLASIESIKKGSWIEVK